MITIEELIVQSLYHRLVLITIRRSRDPDHEPGDRSSHGDHGSGADQGTDRRGTIPESFDHKRLLSNQGLGYLYLGSSNAYDGRSGEQLEISDSISSGIASVAAEDYDVNTNALIHSLNLKDENFQVSRQVHRISDSDDLNLTMLKLKSTEVQTDFEPHWHFRSDSLNLINYPQSSDSRQHFAEVPMAPSIDLRNCDQFSVIRLEDKRDQKSLVVVNTENSMQTRPGVDVPTYDIGLEELQNLSLTSEKLEPKGAALFMEDSDGRFNRESIQLPSFSGKSQGGMDSGIWDIMSSLQSGNPQKSFDLFKSKSSQDLLASDSNDLHGSYKMFQITDNFENTAVNGNNTVNGNGCLVESSSEANDEQNYIDSQNKVKDGGLGDILKPLTVVNFVVHRVEAEVVKLERVETNCEEPQCSKMHELQFHATPEKGHALRNLKLGKTSVLKRRCNSAKRQSRFSFRGNRSSFGGDLYKMQHSSAIDDENSDSENKSQPRDIIEITSVQVSTPLSSNQSRTKSKKFDSGNDDFQWEVRKPYFERKSRSERSSPMSSQRELDHFETLTQTRSAVHSASVSPIRQGFSIVCPVNNIPSSDHQAESSGQFSWPAFHPSSDQSISSADWTAENSSTVASSMSSICEQIEFERFADWMKALPVELQSVPLSHLCIPGSHIAVAIDRDMKTNMDFSKCNYEMADFLRKLPNLPVFNNFRAQMKSIWQSWMPKQWLSIRNQLMAGSRYLDMRITKHSGTLYGEHGLYTRQLKKYLRDVRIFVEEHTCEVVIIHFQSSEFLDRSDKRHLVTVLFQVFGTKMACKSTAELPSLSWMWQNRKQVLIFFPNSDMELIQNHIFGGLVWSDDIVDILSPKKQLIEELKSYLSDAYVSLSQTNRNSSRLSILKAVLSPDMSMVFGKYDYRSMKELALAETSHAIIEWLDKKDRLNIVAVDFVGVPGLVRNILQLNEFRLQQSRVSSGSIGQ